jgi:hypothetical protein
MTISNPLHQEQKHKSIAPHQYPSAVEDMQDKCLLAARNYSTSHIPGAKACHLWRRTEQALHLSPKWLEACTLLFHHSHDQRLSMHFASLRVSVLVLSFLLFAAYVFTNAFYTHSAFMVEFLLACVLFSHDLRWGRKKETGRYMYYGLWEKKKKASCSLHRTRMRSL